MFPLHLMTDDNLNDLTLPGIPDIDLNSDSDKYNGFICFSTRAACRDMTEMFGIVSSPSF